MKTAICKDEQCECKGLPQPIENFPITKEKYYPITNEATGERRKLAKCRRCLQRYQRERKAVQRAKEAKAKEVAEQANSRLVLIPVASKAPRKALEKSALLTIGGKLYRKLD